LIGGVALLLNKNQVKFILQQNCFGVSEDDPSDFLRETDFQKAK
jgi:hypothetical protein